MMKILEQFSKQPLSLKIGFLIILLVVIAAVEYQTIYVPKKDELERLKKQSANLKVKLLENQAIADNLPKFQEEVNILNEQLDQAVSLLPNDADIHSLYRQLAIVAKKTNVELLKFRPAGNKSNGFYSDINMELKIDGTFHDIAMFIDQVGKLNRIVNISNIVFSQPKVKGTSVHLSIDCKATTFMFNGGKS